MKLEAGVTFHGCDELRDLLQDKMLVPNLNCNVWSGRGWIRNVILEIGARLEPNTSSKVITEPSGLLQVVHSNSYGLIDQDAGPGEDPEVTRMSIFSISDTQHCVDAFIPGMLAHEYGIKACLVCGDFGFPTVEAGNAWYSETGQTCNRIFTYDLVEVRSFRVLRYLHPHDIPGSSSKSKFLVQIVECGKVCIPEPFSEKVLGNPKYADGSEPPHMMPGSFDFGGFVKALALVDDSNEIDPRFDERVVGDVRPKNDEE
mmetsp:Transcript_56855/g.165067  ORF Transcript_56855/g.165067 Transcript_56855/m.165067 type:complete len:258 (-) Transcript_56855:116-889(-)